MSNWQQEPLAHDAAEVRARHEANRRAWNEGALVYRQDNEARVRNLRAGKSNLHPVERENLARYGPLEQWCRRAIHLQCASGYDTLSLLLEGAHEVVGVDISEVHIENARWTSAQLELNASWYCCDLLDTPAHLDRTADLVYTGRGALCWLHDLYGWAAVVARLLRPGGILHLFDDHPASWLFSQESEALAPSGVDYFAHAEQGSGWTEEYIGNQGKPPEEHATKHERLWTLADVVQALLGAGLVLAHLGEHAEEYWDGFPRLKPEDKAKIPMTFSIVARKPATGSER